jgi:hypothetical protein
MDRYVFFAGNALIAPVWFLMIVAPRWKVTQWVVRSLVAPALVAVIYLVLVLTNMGATRGGFFTLEDVVLLFQNQRVVLTGWMHYLAFDLVVGSWIFRDARAEEVPHVALAPCLALTLLFGPIGLLAYLAVRGVRRRRALVLP